MTKLLIIDGNSIVNRAFYAIRELNDWQGRNINAVFGFVNILMKALQGYKPDKLIVAFDKHGHNFRKDIYSEYKATRKGMPDDLATQMPILEDLLQKMSITVIEKAGVEADDIIGTVTKNFEGESLVLSGDRDMLQLVDKSVTVLLTKKGVSEVETVTLDSIKALYGLSPSQIIEYKALRGDTSDNIPGVKGIGEKTAMALLEKYGDIDNVFANVDNEKGALREKLIEGKEMAYISRQLATIVRDVDIRVDLDNCGLYVLTPEVRDIMEKLGFRSIIARLNFDGIPQSQNTENEETVEITTVAELQKVVVDMRNELFAFHYENNAVYFAKNDEVTYHADIRESFLDELNAETVFAVLKPLLESDSPKTVYDKKTLRRRLKAEGIELKGVKFDVCLMQYLVEYRSYKDIKSLIDAYGHKTIAAGIYAVTGKLTEKLKNDGTFELYEKIEFPLSDVLFEMEEEGVAVDLELLNKMSAQLHNEMDELTYEIHELAGETFNINSAPQLSKILFEKLNLPHGKKNQTGYTTNNETLEFLRDKHPIVEKILEYRKVSKLLSTYVDGLKPLVKNGLVHTTFNQMLTSTGRLSSSDPNLQNIPIRDDMGKEIRKLFRSKHGVFVGADYSQIELRLIASFSGDENLLESFKNGIDIHAKVASELMGIPVEMVNKDMRRMAKAVNFGIIYGISDFGLAQSANISRKQAHEYIQLYFQRFPKIKAYLDSCVEEARENGFVTTITGRRRQIPEVKSSNHNLRAFGERAAMNMPLQGTAADIIKIAMLRVDAALKQQHLKSKQVLQIHDEIIVDCFREEAEQVKRIVKEEMENAFILDCPLVAETEEGETLYEA